MSWHCLNRVNGSPSIKKELLRQLQTSHTRLDLGMLGAFNYSTYPTLSRRATSLCTVLDSTIIFHRLFPKSYISGPCDSSAKLLRSDTIPTTLVIIQVSINTYKKLDVTPKLVLAAFHAPLAIWHLPPLNRRYLLLSVVLSKLPLDGVHKAVGNHSEHYLPRQPSVSPCSVPNLHSLSY